MVVRVDPFVFDLGVEWAELTTDTQKVTYFLGQLFGFEVWATTIGAGTTEQDTSDFPLPSSETRIAILFSFHCPFLLTIRQLLRGRSTGQISSGFGGAEICPKLWIFVEKCG